MCITRSESPNWLDSYNAYLSKFGVISKLEGVEKEIAELEHFEEFKQLQPGWAPHLGKLLSLGEDEQGIFSDAGYDGVSTSMLIEWLDVEFNVDSSKLDDDSREILRMYTAQRKWNLGSSYVPYEEVALTNYDLKIFGAMYRLNASADEPATAADILQLAGFPKRKKRAFDNLKKRGYVGSKKSVGYYVTAKGTLKATELFRIRASETKG